jgi:hypothetical protein
MAALRPPLFRLEIHRDAIDAAGAIVQSGS